MVLPIVKYYSTRADRTPDYSMQATNNKLLIATSNKGKFSELASLLAGSPFELVSLRELNLTAEAPESGSTFEENAVSKAMFYSQASRLPALADDSGLEVDALGGEPGVMSARYAGPGATDAELVAYLLCKLKNIPDQNMSAQFRCVIAIAWPTNAISTYTGECSGKIIRTPRGSNGFGYDPIFLLPEMNRTMAELTQAEKNRLSHRSIATRKALEALRNIQGTSG